VRIFLLVSSLLLATTSFAVSRDEIKTLSDLKYDGKTLTFTYRAGGGFEDHSAEVQLELLNIIKGRGEYSADAKIKIFDVCPKPDNGRSLVSVNGKADIQQLIVKKAEEAGIKGTYITVKQIELLPVTFHPIQLP
jgi:hypothetical protein